MAMDKQLKKLREKIDELEQWHGDTDNEVAHVEADRILLDTIMLLCTEIGHEDVGIEIVKAFEKIDKWYA